MRSGFLRAALTALLAVAGAAQAAAPATGLQRIVALGGDITETVYALGAQNMLVGVDSTSEWPVAAKRLPNVGYVRQLNAEGVLALHPRLIVATHDAGPPQAIAQLRSAGVRIEVMPPSRTPADVVAKIRAVGHLLDRHAEAQRLAAKIEGEYDDLARRVAGMHSPPRVLFLLSFGNGSPMAAGQGTAADTVIALAGGRNVAQGYKGYKPVSAEALAALAPQLIVVMGDGDHARALDAVMKLPGVAQTPAGASRRIVPVDGEALLGFGPRSAEQTLLLQRTFASASP
ncbi:MAG TPA: hemin ABC transporter substrate-binding protein [Rhodanobacteraceae bacterium]|nr:hemin ABC transporter substrate-binding protein [Rhodanobacteraceae bacterium]